MAGSPGLSEGGINSVQRQSQEDASDGLTLPPAEATEEEENGGDDVEDDEQGSSVDVEEGPEVELNDGENETSEKADEVMEEDKKEEEVEEEREKVGEEEGEDTKEDTVLEVQEELENADEEAGDVEQLDDEEQEATHIDDAFFEELDTGTLQQGLDVIEEKIDELEDLDDNNIVAEEEEDLLYNIEGEMLEEAIEEDLETIDTDLDELRERNDDAAWQEKNTLSKLSLELTEEEIKEAVGDEGALDVYEKIQDVEQQISNLEGAGKGAGNETVPETRDQPAANEEEAVPSEIKDEVVMKELENVEEEIVELERSSGGDEEGQEELEEKIYENLQEIEEDVDKLEGLDDSVVEEEKEELYELEDELMDKVSQLEDLDGDDFFEYGDDYVDLLVDSNDYDDEWPEYVEETESETKELNEEEAAEDELENLGNYEQNNGESRLSWGKIRGWVSDKGNNDVAKYEVWLALPLVLMLFFAAYRCKSRRSSGPRRSPHTGGDGYADIQLVGDSTMI